MVTVTDIFAGAGGTSTGIGQVAGAEVAIAANHWRHNTARGKAGHLLTPVSEPITKPGSWCRRVERGTRRPTPSIVQCGPCPKTT